jgi:hypothetical protein
MSMRNRPLIAVSALALFQPGPSPRTAQTSDASRRPKKLPRGMSALVPTASAYRRAVGRRNRAKPSISRNVSPVTARRGPANRTISLLAGKAHLPATNLQ